MESWKHFDQNPITHSAAHHLGAIADLLEKHGYARVSDVAHMLEITRGSVSVTLKNLKSRGLVTEDERRHLGLSEEGMKIAQAIRAKKHVLVKLFRDVLGVDGDQADIDTCKIEHLVSSATAERVMRFLRFVASDSAVARRFREALAGFPAECGRDPGGCPVCGEACLAEMVTSFKEPTRD